MNEHQRLVLPVIMDLVEPYLTKVTDCSWIILIALLLSMNSCMRKRQYHVEQFDKTGKEYHKLFWQKPPELTHGSNRSTIIWQFLKHNNLTIVQWKDKKDVFALSTFHTCNDELPCKPEMITTYNQFMNVMIEPISYFHTTPWTWRVVNGRKSFLEVACIMHH